MDRFVIYCVFNVPFCLTFRGCGVFRGLAGGHFWEYSFVVGGFRPAVLDLSGLLVCFISTLTCFLIFNTGFPFLLIPAEASVIALNMFAVICFVVGVVCNNFSVNGHGDGPVVCSLVLSLFFASFTTRFFVYMVGIAIMGDNGFICRCPVLLVSVCVVRIFLAIVFACLKGCFCFYVGGPSSYVVVAHGNRSISDVLPGVGHCGGRCGVARVICLGSGSVLRGVGSASVIFFCGLSIDRQGSLIRCYCRLGGSVCCDMRLSSVISSSDGHICFSSGSVIHTPVPHLAFRREVLGHFVSLTVSTLNLVLASPLLLVMTVLVGTRSRNPIFCGRRHFACNNGVFGIVGFHSVGTRINSVRLSTAGSSSHVAHVKRFVEGFEVSRLPRLVGMVGNRVDVMNPHPRVVRGIIGCAGRLPRFTCHRHTGTNLANVTRVCNGCGASPGSGLVFSLACVGRCDV